MPRSEAGRPGAGPRLFFRRPLLAAAGGLCLAATTLAAAERMTVGVVESRPFAAPAADEGWTGVAVELWQRVAHDLGRTVEWQAFASLDDLSRAVATGRVVAGVGQIPIAGGLDPRLDFSVPFHQSGLAFCTRTEPASGWAEVARTLLSADVIQAVAGVLLLAVAFGGTLWWIERRHPGAQFNPRPMAGWGEGVWWSFVTMTTTGYGDKVPVSWLGRSLAVVFMLISILVVSALTATISAAHIRASLRDAINSPGDLAKVRVGTVGDVPARYATTRELRAHSFPTLTAALGALESRAIDAVIAEGPALRDALRRHANHGLQAQTHQLFPQSFAFLLPAGSPDRARINAAILQQIESRTWQERLQRGDDPPGTSR